MKNWKAWLWVIAIFLAGALFGAVATTLATRSFIRKAANNPEFVHQMIVKRLSSRLDLDPEQRRQVDEIVIRTQARVRELRAQVQPQFVLILADSEDEISAVLNPAQREQFKEFIAERKKLWKIE